MLSNIKYRVSLFADYSNIYYSNDNIKVLLDKFQMKDLYPSIIPEINAVGNNHQGIMLCNKNNTYSVSVMTERVDVTIISELKSGFDEEDKKDIYNVLKMSVDNIYKSFEDIIQDAYRFALYTEYAYFQIDETTKEEFRDRFIKKVDCLEEKITTEFAVQYAAREETEIREKKELFNLITNISRLMPAPGISNGVDGFLISFDINSHQSIRKNRINSSNIEDYIYAAIPFQAELSEGFLNGCR